eukprot:407018_1
MSEGYSQLNSFDESMYVAGTYLMVSGLTIATIILLSLYAQKAEIQSIKSFQFAKLSIICSMLVHLSTLIFANDLLFEWQFDDKHLSFISMVDSIVNVFYALGKITFYCSFTYYVLSVFDESSKTRKYLKIWMIIACLLIFCSVIAYTIDDALENPLKEIGVTSNHNIYLVQKINDGAKYAPIFLYLALIIDVIYFSILLYCYIKQIRIIKSGLNEIKGVVLMFSACLVFWCFMFFGAIRSPFVWLLFAIDVASDDICLFLMFEDQTKIYKFWCKGCNACCFKLVFGSTRMIINDVRENLSDGDMPGNSTNEFVMDYMGLNTPKTQTVAIDHKETEPFPEINIDSQDNKL